MYLEEINALYLESCENENNKCSLSMFCNLSQRMKECASSSDSLKEQYKCQVHENLFLKLEVMGCSYESSWMETVSCAISPNSPCWNNTCEDCKDDQKLIPKKGLNAMTCYKQWEYIEAHSHLRIPSRKLPL